MLDNHDKNMNAYVIEMRRNDVKRAIESLRYYRKADNLSAGTMSIVVAQANNAIAIYRQTNKVLHKYL